MVAGSLLHAALFADVLFALDGLLRGSFCLGSNAVLIQPQSWSPHRGAVQWEVSSCKEEDSVHRARCNVWMAAADGGLVEGQVWVLALCLSWLWEGCEVHDSRDGSAIFITSLARYSGRGG